MNKILIGYRNMLGFTQLQMAEKLGISVVSYRNKELGKDFTQSEIRKIMSILKEEFPELTADKIFFKGK